MNKFVAFALIGAACGSPAFATPPAAAAQTSFTRDGSTYYFTTSDMGRYTLIRGHDDQGRKFELHQTGKRVAGYYAGSYLAFATPKPAEVATR